MKSIVGTEIIKERIFILRSQRVMLDSDLARLYGIETKVLIQAVKRNKERFPPKFMFQLRKVEYESLRSQFVTSNRGGRRYRPYAFTEHGVAMLSSVLKSDRAIQVNIAIIKAFIKMREILNTHRELMNKLKELEQRVGRHDQEIQAILNAIRQLMAPPPQKKKEPIGFRPYT